MEQDIVGAPMVHLRLASDQPRAQVVGVYSYWPFAWPEAEVFNLTLQAGSLALPVRVASGDVGEWVFPEAEAAPALAMEVLREREGEDLVFERSWKNRN